MCERKPIGRFYLVVCIFSILCFCACSKTDPVVEQIKTEIEKELPSGSTKSEVIRFLDSKGIEYSDPFAKPGDHVLKDRFINATIRNVVQNMGVSSDILITFTFDKEDRLMKHRVEARHTGP